MYFPIIARLEIADSFLALNQNGQCGCLHAPNGGLVEATLFGIERGHGARAINANQPIRF